MYVLTTSAPLGCRVGLQSGIVNVAATVCANAVLPRGQSFAGSGNIFEFRHSHAGNQIINLCCIAVVRWLGKMPASPDAGRSFEFVEQHFLIIQLLSGKRCHGTFLVRARSGCCNPCRQATMSGAGSLLAMPFARYRSWLRTGTLSGVEKRQC